ncbi:hypothetical protein YC2023_117924 [Brassica napus]
MLPRVGTIVADRFWKGNREASPIHSHFRSRAKHSKAIGTLEVIHRRITKRDDSRFFIVIFSFRSRYRSGVSYKANHRCLPSTADSTSSFFHRLFQGFKPGSIKDTDLTLGWEVQPTDGSSPGYSNGP